MRDLHLNYKSLSALFAVLICVIWINAPVAKVEEAMNNKLRDFLVEFKLSAATKHKYMKVSLAYINAAPTDVSEQAIVIKKFENKPL